MEAPTVSEQSFTPEQVAAAAAEFDRAMKIVQANGMIPMDQERLGKIAHLLLSLKLLANGTHDTLLAAFSHGLHTEEAKKILETYLNSVKITIEMLPDAYQEIGMVFSPKPAGTSPVEEAVAASDELHDSLEKMDPKHVERAKQALTDPEDQGVGRGDSRVTPLLPHDPNLKKRNGGEMD
jgi:hypothetical protein